MKKFIIGLFVLISGCTTTNTYSNWTKASITCGYGNRSLGGLFYIKMKDNYIIARNPLNGKDLLITYPCLVLPEGELDD